MKKPRVGAAFSFPGWNYVQALGRFSGNPFTQMEVFFNLPAFVAMFAGFLGLIIHFAEWVLGITDSFGNDFQRFCHSCISFVQFKPGVKDANGLSLVRPTVQLNWHRLLQATQLYDIYRKDSFKI